LKQEEWAKNIKIQKEIYNYHTAIILETAITVAIIQMLLVPGLQIQIPKILILMESAFQI